MNLRTASTVEDITRLPGKDRHAAMTALLQAERAAGWPSTPAPQAELDLDRRSRHRQANAEYRQTGGMG